LEERREIISPCIYDVKQVRHIGGNIKRSDILELQKKYLSGIGTLDSRRCMAFQLLRCHANDPQFVRNVILNLRDEIDQTNAYYIMKYLRQWGIYEHNNLIDKEILLSIEAAAMNFPENKYLLESYKTIQKKFAN